MHFELMRSERRAVHSFFGASQRKEDEKKTELVSNCFFLYFFFLNFCLTINTERRKRRNVGAAGKLDAASRRRCVPCSSIGVGGRLRNVALRPVTQADSVSKFNQGNPVRPFKTQ